MRDKILHLSFEVLIECIATKGVANVSSVLPNAINITSINITGLHIKNYQVLKLFENNGLVQTIDAMHLIN